MYKDARELMDAFRMRGEDPSVVEKHGNNYIFTVARGNYQQGHDTMEDYLQHIMDINDEFTGMELSDLIIISGNREIPRIELTPHGLGHKLMEDFVDYLEGYGLQAKIID